MTVVPGIRFSDSIDLSDWVLLLNSRGEIACEVWLGDTMESCWFTLSKSDLNSASPEELISAISRRFSQALDSPPVKTDSFVPTIIGFTTAPAA